jgi:hypothetical protein
VPSNRVAPGPLPLVALGVVAALAGLALLLATPHGVGMPSDSVAYTDAAGNLADGDGLSLSGAYPHLEGTRQGEPDFPLVHWPPAFPTLLAGLSVVDGDSVSAARWVMIGLLAVNSLLFGLLAWRIAGRSRPAAIIGAALFALSPVGIPLHGDALSEPLFFLFAFGGLELVARHLESDRLWWLVAGGALVSLALLTRYAAPALAATCFLALFAFAPGTLPRRLLRAAAFSAAVLVPLVLWLARNSAVADTATGRGGPTWNPPSSSDLVDAVGAVTEWFAPSFLPDAARALLAVAVVAGGVLAVSALRGSRAWTTLEHGVKVRVALFGGLAVLYALFVIVSAAFFDAAIDTRGFAPAWSALLVVAVGVVATVLAGTERPRRALARPALAASLTLVLLAFLVQVVEKVHDLGGEDLGYKSDSWRRSATMARVERLPPDTRVYSNAPDAVYLLTGREVKSIPPRVDPLADQPNPSYARRLRELRRSLRGGAVVAYFHAVDNRPYLPDESTLRRQASLSLTRRIADGALYAGR